jgi:hypothetical protein
MGGILVYTAPVGLLVNFGRVRLEWKREFPTKKLDAHLRNKRGRQVKSE